MPDQLVAAAPSESGWCDAGSSDHGSGAHLSVAPPAACELDTSSAPPPTSSLLLPFVDPPLLSCTMQKRSPTAPALWQVRHFILYPDLLLYSTNESPSSLSSPLGLVPLSSIIYVTSLPSSPLRFDFIVQADKSTHTFQLLTGSAELTSQWVRRMRRLTEAGNAGRVGEEESGWYDRKGKFWKNVDDIAMRRRVRRAHADYESHHPRLTANSPTPTAPLLSGFIRKKSPALLQLWQSRYFVLYPAVIVYSRSMGSDMLGALALLSLVWMDRKDECRLDISVEAEDGTGLGRERIIQLQMDSDEERDLWCARISQQLAIVKRDHSSASHSRSISAGEEQLDQAGQASELKQTGQVVPGSLLFTQQRKAHAHTPYVGAVKSSLAVPSLQSQQPHDQPPPLPPQAYSQHHGLSPPSFLGKPMPPSPLSVIKQSKRLASQSKAAGVSSHSPPSPSHYDMPLTATLSSITASSPAAAAPLAPFSSASPHGPPLPTTPYPPQYSIDAAAVPQSESVVRMTTVSASCYTDRPSSAVRPLIKRLADDSAANLHSSDDFLLPAVSHKSELSRSRNLSASQSASSPPLPVGGLLDEGIILTLFKYTAECDTLSLCDIVLGYSSYSHTLTCKPADAIGGAAELHDEQQQQQQQQQLAVGVDELESVTIGRQSDTMRQLSTNIGDECCLTVRCADDEEINVVAKGAALIKLLHKELSILIGDVAADDQPPHDSDSADELHAVDQQADDKLDEADGPVGAQPTATLSTPASLAPYLSATHLVPILSTSPNLSRSRSAPVGATLRFQDKIEVHEYVQPASYTPSQELDLDHGADIMLTYSQQDDGPYSNTYSTDGAADELCNADEYEPPIASEPQTAADDDVTQVQHADRFFTNDHSELKLANTVDIPVAPPMHSTPPAAREDTALWSASSDASNPSPIATTVRSQSTADLDCSDAPSAPPEYREAAVDAKRSKFGALCNPAAASLDALMQELADRNKPSLDAAAVTRPAALSIDDVVGPTARSDRSPLASSSSPRSISSSSNVSTATNAFGVRLRSVSPHTAAAPVVSTQAAGSKNTPARTTDVPTSDTLVMDVQSTDAAELAEHDTAEPGQSAISLTLDFEVGYSSPSITARSIVEDKAAATAQPTLSPITAAIARPRMTTADAERCELSSLSADGSSGGGPSPSHASASSIVFAPAARLLQCPSTLTMHRAVSSPAAAAASAPSSTLHPAQLIKPVLALPDSPQAIDEGASGAAVPSGGLSVSALKAIWQQSSPTAGTHSAAHQRLTARQQ